jgi:hypothetical protein
MDWMFDLAGFLLYHDVATSTVRHSTKQNSVRNRKDFEKQVQNTEPSLNSQPDFVLLSEGSLISMLFLLRLLAYLKVTRGVYAFFCVKSGIYFL